MNVVNASLQISLVPDGVFPETTLPDTPLRCFTRDSDCGDSAPPFSIHRFVNSSLTRIHLIE